jgi:hypothetical protein
MRAAASTSRSRRERVQNDFGVLGGRLLAEHALAVLDEEVQRLVRARKERQQALLVAPVRALRHLLDRALVGRLDGGDELRVEVVREDAGEAHRGRAPDVLQN